MTTDLMVRPGTRRAAILAHLTGHPELTGSELQRVIGSRGSVERLLMNMEQRGQVTATRVRRPGQGGLVRVWRIAPAGTVPPPVVPLSAEQLDERQARIRDAHRGARPRTVTLTPGPGALPGAACASEDPEMFFPSSKAEEAKARAVCDRCPARASCYAGANARHERFGVWGGVNFEHTGHQAVSA